MSNFSVDGYTVRIHDIISDLWDPRRIVKFGEGKISHWLPQDSMTINGFQQPRTESCGHHLIGQGVYLMVRPEVIRDPEVKYIPSVEDFINNPYFEELKKIEILDGLISERIRETVDGIRDKVEPYLKEHEDGLEKSITNKVIQEFMNNTRIFYPMPRMKKSKEVRKSFLEVVRRELPKYIEEPGFKKKMEPTIDLIGYVTELHHLIPEFIELRDLLFVATVHAE